ncbi:MAG: bifunctional diaminohydroxyphosphoribosylaminopyrimidine deaminase/5-amino-6-(5-phosphoribosylamino)uracil reductase RibD [Pseudoflavonifractor sp.]|nr:bifunctional diaminohydroxyphosphoribosylaminopyrimidine deaminase/5-amino-6-(5-phosphoribosylamino)uracil reductase RibD [Alloprevotella sp.]MCM1116507.1 bifunctional diaminohydroxyphosphoribosylaminopyrimidine deaminase/5-amino-6-(5-phosphoribosylamino)uracil reductase RibD [Pseudoflavonifractor sp.]
MARALQLARNGRLDASPNPMVGAVIVDPDGRIIGEGWHRQVGKPHAEVNAINSVVPHLRHLLAKSTMYVTLEPCSHWGRTPPCARLIIETGIPQVVVAMADPFPKVSGRGIDMLRQAGVEVVVGVMELEAMELNRRFIKAHTSGRPWVTLKWAQSTDGFIDARRDADQPPYRFSTPLSSIAVHRLRACHDAILIGSGTAMADNPRLDTRLITGLRPPRRVVVDRQGRVAPTAHIFEPPYCIYYTSARRVDLPAEVEQVEVDSEASPADILADLHAKGISSVLVEGGSKMLQAFLDASLADAVKVETSPTILGTCGSVRAPRR